MFKPFSRGVLSVALLLMLNTSAQGLARDPEPESAAPGLRAEAGAHRPDPVPPTSRPVQALREPSDDATRWAWGARAADDRSGWAVFLALWGLVLAWIGVLLWFNRMPARRRSS